MSLSARVLIGLLLGVALGLFLGELVEPLRFVGDGFLLLLQMTVLPYVAVSLVLGLGSLKPADARALALRAGSFLVVLSALVVVLLPLVPLAFPDWPSASFFSSNLVADPQAFDLVRLYIPANPFRALAENTVPAVVVFSSALGVAIMGIEGKHALLDALQVVSDALLRIASFVVQLAPLGVFAIAARAAGTLDPARFWELQVYLFIFSGLALVLGLWAVPVLVTSLTPLSYRDVVLRTRGALITAFATGSVFVVLPVVAARSKELLAREEVAPGESGRFVDVVVPIAFTFPTVGKLLRLAFVLFAGWISGFPLAIARWGELLLTGPIVLFAHTFVAVPFLLELFRIPSDTFQLLVLTDSVVGDRFSAFLGASHVMALTLLSGCALAGTVRVQWSKLAVWAGGTLALSLGVLLGVRLIFGAVGPPQDTYRSFIDRDAFLPAPTPRVVELGQLPPALEETRALERIRARGALRVGYLPESLPYAFRNDKGALVGLDVEMAGELARNLGVELELAKLPAQPDTVADLLDRGVVDVVMSGLIVVPSMLQRIAYSTPYVEETLAFLVEDHRRDEFEDLEKIRRMPELRVAVLKDTAYYTDLLQQALPQAEVVEVSSPRDFLRGAVEADAMLSSAELGSSWCLIYPAYSVAVPHPARVGLSIAYAVARHDLDMLMFLDHWVELKRKDGTIDLLFDYWVKGERAQGFDEPRWSVVRDVLGWVD